MNTFSDICILAGPGGFHQFVERMFTAVQPLEASCLTVKMNIVNSHSGVANLSLDVAVCVQ